MKNKPFTPKVGTDVCIEDYFPTFSSEEVKSIRSHILPFLKKEMINRRYNEHELFFKKIRRFLIESEAHALFDYLLGMSEQKRAIALEIILYPLGFKQKHLRAFLEKPSSATFDKLKQVGMNEEKSDLIRKRLEMARKARKKQNDFAMPDGRTIQQQASQPKNHVVNERVYPAIPDKTTDLLKNEVSNKGKKYTVDVEGILHKLYDKVQAADWPKEATEQKRWWRLVYAYLKDRKIIEVFVKEKYAPFVNFVVAYCQPDINCKTLADNFGRNVKLPMKKKRDVMTGDYIDVPDTSSVEKLLDGCLKEAS